MKPNPETPEKDRNKCKSVGIALDFLNTLSPENIFISDREGRFTYASPAGAHSMGLNSMEIVGKTWQELGFVPEAEPFDLQHETVFASGQPLTGETSMPTFNGKKSYEYVLSPIFDIDNCVEAIECTVKDITERKRVTRVIQDAQEYAEYIMDTIHEPLIVLDADLRVLLANPSFYQAFKITPEETEWQFLHELAKGKWKVPRLRAQLERFLIDDNDFEDFEISYDFPKLGQKTLLVNVRKIYRATDKSHVILLTFLDLTDRIRAEKAWLETEEWFSATLRTLTEAVFAIDDNGLLKFMNPAAENLAECEQDNAIGKPWLDVFKLGNELGNVAVEKNIDQTLRGGGTHELNEPTVLTTKTGTKIAVTGTCTAVRNDSENVMGTVLVVRKLPEG